MKTRTYELIFWLSALAGAVTMAFGCEAFQRAGEVAVTPVPELGGKSPVEVIVEKVPEIVTNPANPFPWLEVGGAAVAIVLAFFGVKKSGAAGKILSFFKR